MDCDRKPLATTYIGAIPVDTLNSVPDYMLAERDAEDPNTGKVIRSMVRVPAGKLFGGGRFDNVTTIEPNNEIEVPEDQVIAGKIQNNGSYNTVAPADAEADFIIIGKMGEMLLIQNTGFITIPNGHQYVVGQDYWLSATTPGEVVTDSTSGVHLFKPISSTQLAVNIYTV